VSDSRQRFGRFFTPPEVAQTLVRRVITSPRQRLLAPSCGDGEFLVCHRRAVGVDIDREHAVRARTRAPAGLVQEGDFFLWASRTSERSGAAAGKRLQWDEGSPALKSFGLESEMQRRLGYAPRLL